MRSGIRSWSKWVIFSRRMKSSMRVGPRRPALSEFWLSATGTPWLVVSPWPVASVRTRSSGPLAGLAPVRGSPLPALAEAFASLRVLPPAEGMGGGKCSPSGARAAAGPYSAGLVRLRGMDAARSPSAATLAATGSSSRAAAGPRFEPLTVERAVAFAADFFPGEAPGLLPFRIMIRLPARTGPSRPVQGIAPAGRGGVPTSWARRGPGARSRTGVHGGPALERSSRWSRRARRDR